VNDEQVNEGDPRHPRAQIGMEPGAATCEIHMLAGRWILMAHWVGGRRIVEQAIWFAFCECGNDWDFVREQVERTQQLAKPWIWREACLAVYKRRQAIPRTPEPKPRPQEWRKMTPAQRGLRPERRKE
jgi:hypothetical protein